MKTKTILLLFSLIVLQSCNTVYYQVYETQAAKNVERENDGFIYEDQNCIVQYNLWSDGGDAGFSIYNKTDKTLYLDKFNTHFVINGIAKDYYLDRVFTNNETVAVNSLFYNISSESSVSTSYKEKAIIAVPSKTKRKISEYKITDSFLIDCNLEKYPNRREVRTESFTENTSPFMFENRISYFFDKDEDFNEIKNAFYVSGITNYPSNEIIDQKEKEECGESKFGTVEINTEESPHKFYISYKKQ